MREIEVGDIVLVRESADSKHRLRRCSVMCDGPLVHEGLRTGRTWFLRSQVTPWPDYFWEKESNLVRVD